MSSKTFYIFRHALATHSLEGYGDQILTAEILPEAIPPIERMSNYLKTISTDANFVSEFIRCQQTANIISRITDKSFITDKRMNEFYHETFTQFRERIKSFLEEVEQKNYQRILICTHGAVIAGIKSFLLKNDFTEDNMFDFPPTGVLTEIKDNLATENDFN